MAGEDRIIASTRDELNDVGPGFCLAKWLQVTLHLHNGQTHSCHHPGTHGIPLKEIAEDPSALHNTRYKKQLQRDMIAGARPNECQYCWNVEDLPGNQISDRYIKSSEMAWAGSDKIQEIVNATNNGEPVNPTYVEVNFSNVCNFKCGYCSPKFSSQWTHEIDKHGPYELETIKYNDIDYMKAQGSFPLHHKDKNPYVEAFWKWWPELVKTLKVFRITGGEPLLDDNTFKVMDMLSKYPNPELELSFNSNLGVPKDVITKYINNLKPLIDDNKIRRSVLYTSVDAHGKQAEYGRHGLDYKQWLSNLDRVLTDIPNLKATIMCTGNILSITSFQKLLEDVYNLRIKHYHSNRLVPLTIDISILRWPIHYNVSILPPEYAKMIEGCVTYMQERQENTNGNPPYQGFYYFEIEKLKRFIETIKQPLNKAENRQVKDAWIDFKKFVDEHDRRRGTNFLETFPELTEFYKNIKIQ